MMKSFYIFFFFLAFISCKENVRDEELYNIQADIRLGYKFYSIYVSRQGRAYVVKGESSFYTDTLKIKSSDTSEVFKLDSARLFFETLNKIKAYPIYIANQTGTAQRAEVYYDHQKVYDSYAWDKSFWDLFRPIIEQIPKGYNPFRVSEMPFFD